MSLDPGRLTDLTLKSDSVLDTVGFLDTFESATRSLSDVFKSEQLLWLDFPLALMAATATSLVAMIAVAARLQRQKNATATTQQTLDAMPDAIALFDKRGKLTALNQKLARLMPLKIEPAAFCKTDTNNLYAQISPDTLTLERARARARKVAHDPNATISFEAPSYGKRSLLVKERGTQDGGVSVSVYGSINPTQHRLNDPLTALATRTRLVQELTQRCSRTKNELSLIIVDLRSFRQINDTYGREAGDELLKQTANCLLRIMPEDALIARTAGDEFAVLLESDLGRPAIEKLLQGLLTTLRNGLSVGEMNVPVRASVGIAYAPEHGNTVSSLLTSADSACAQAKQGTENAMVVFNSVQQQQAKRRHQLEIGLQLALGENELSLQYQPQIDIKSKMTCGMEALLRWNSAEFGKVSPVDFIPIAEETGIINHLGTWVLNQAVTDYQRLARYGMSPAMLSVNLSRKQFEGGRIVDDVEKLLKNTNFDPAKLCLEITETSLSNDSKKLREQLIDLTSLGVRLSIDDFGVGYSSLLELRDYPISEVKIDRAFITDIASNINSQDFVRAIVDISKSIGAEVVAEGIENQEQFDVVDQLGCDRAQGYFLCEPMAATTFPDFVLSS